MRPFAHWCARTRLEEWPARYRRGVVEGAAAAVTSHERVSPSPPCLPARLEISTRPIVMARKRKKQRLEIVHPRCAGIDVGSREHWVAVDPESTEKPVQHFTTFTDDLHRLADWLQSLQVEVVAMEATGVYWIPLYETLDARGFQVHLVNSRATRQVSGHGHFAQHRCRRARPADAREAAGSAPACR